MDPVRFAVVGGGLISAVHATALAALEDTVLVGFVGGSGATARADEFGVRHFGDLAAVAAAGVEAVVICTPTPTHAEMGIAAARLGLHVLTEKPVDAAIAAAERLVAVCEDEGVVLGVVSQRRFDGGFLALTEVVEAGSLGRLTLGSAAMKCWRDDEYYSGSWHGRLTAGGGGALINQGIHVLDLLCAVMGRVASVTALRRTVAHDVEVEDTLLAMLEFESGAVGTLETTTAFYTRVSGPAIPNTVERLEVSGATGSMILESGRIAHSSLAGLPDAPAEAMPIRDQTALPESHFVAQYADFVDAIRRGREPRSSGRTGLELLRVIAALYRSADERRPVPVSSSAS